MWRPQSRKNFNTEQEGEDDGGPRSKGPKRFARSAISILLRGLDVLAFLLRAENLAGGPTCTVAATQEQG